MQTETLMYSPTDGWSAPFPELDSPRTLVLVFGGRGLVDRPQPIEAIAEAFPTSILVGCSSAGEIHGAKILDDSLTVAVARFDKGSLRASFARIESPEASHDCGRELAQTLAADDLKGLFVLSDGLNVNGTRLAEGLNSALPPEVIVTGGLAGDGERFEQTWVIRDGKPCEGVVSAVGLYGDSIQITHGSKGGWDVFGLERTITRSEGNVLYELDGKPALQLYKEYLGDRAEGLPATALLFPLAIREGDDDDRSLVRTVLAVDEQAQSMTFAGDLPEGWRAQLMRANFDRLIDGAADAARMAEHAGSAPLVIAISCVGRRLVLGERAEEEVEATLEILPSEARQIGFYSYGEISPCVSGVGQCDLHNQTMTLTTFSEG